MEKKSTVDFIDVTQQTQMIVPNAPIPNGIVSPDNFVKSCESFWQTKGKIASYNQGYTMGNTIRSGIQFNEFLKRLKKAIEEAVRLELHKTGQTSESFKDDFKALESILNIINNHLISMNVEIKDEETMAFFHGFITSYINSVTFSNQP